MLTLATVSCGRQRSLGEDGGTHIAVVFADMAATDDAKNRAAEVVRRRMAAAGVPDPVARVALEGTAIYIELPLQTGNDGMLGELACTPGRFEIVECCERNEVMEIFFEIDRRMSSMPEYAGTETPLFSRYLYCDVDPYFSGPEVGMVPAERAGELETILASDWAKRFFPRGAKPAIVRSSHKDGMCPLVVLIYPADGQAPITGAMIEQASTEKNRWSEGDYVVNFRFSKPFHRTWARLTLENIGHSLALVMDGRVYSAPRVQDEIVGGACQISGNFTADEALTLAAILHGGELPTPLTLAQTAIVAPEKE